jgi:hypothetical protein
MGQLPGFTPFYPILLDWGQSQPPPPFRSMRVSRRSPTLSRSRARRAVRAIPSGRLSTRATANCQRAVVTSIYRVIRNSLLLQIFYS